MKVKALLLVAQMMTATLIFGNGIEWKTEVRTEPSKGKPSVMIITSAATPMLNGAPKFGSVATGAPAAQPTPTRIKEMPIIRMIEPVTTGGKSGKR